MAAVEAPAKEEEPKKEQDEDTEAFSGLRITKRKIPAGAFEQDVRGRDGKYISFPKIGSEFSKKQEQDRIIIGVLYEQLPQSRLGNGALYITWNLTDLNKPEPRLLTLQLVGEAYMHWRSKSVQRGTIVACMNPVLVDSGSAAGQIKVMQVSKRGNLGELGHCPSLGKCETKDCRAPCNVDIGMRFCTRHRSLAFATKYANSNLHSKNERALAAAQEKKRGRSMIDALPLVQDDEKAKPSIGATRTSAALQLEHRKSAIYNANDDYVQSIKTGERPEDKFTSRVAVLGKSMDAGSELELDMAAVSSEDRDKTKRMLERFRMKRQRHVEDEKYLEVGVVPKKSKVALAPSEATQQILDIPRPLTAGHKPANGSGENAAS
mmetsp:Transcript_73946/g.175989  ORF Transcript_73946/g.175989 Transcript_73946/m.175989 type:complete len:378 (-) Transcript_73946:121-1254(-)|eukprot:CAMPEP_0178425840 /NCGR_PEP_ID=MMETSP0689_2-20121128/28927_1 /TAXON_ID=160604 /ORGANISM="Amphidinium massartii, Strain CS-259" /LENGTH=377 /DNA_ID=CAMNT_0020047509 /DNA_START=52 /DNA_END=1185 /DNA_ORIENTATION=-